MSVTGLSVDEVGLPGPSGNGDSDDVDERSQRLAEVLAPWMVELFGRDAGPTTAVLFQLDGIVGESIVFRELRKVAADPGIDELLQQKQPDLREMARRLEPLFRDSVISRRLSELLWAVLSSELRSSPARWRRRVPKSAVGLKRLVMKKGSELLLFVIVLLVPLGTIVLPDGSIAGLTRLDFLEIFAVGVLSFLPGWLFVRFIGFKATAVWDEYVLNVHRLRLDEPQHLPRPPTNSVYHRHWVAAGGPALGREPSIYQQKFDAYYGPSVSRTRTGAVRTETLFPVVLATAILAVGWTAIFARSGVFHATPAGRPDVFDMMAFGFIGAYVFMVQMLVRRYFQGDLKASAYAASVVRVIFSLAVIVVLFQTSALDLDGQSSAAVAFIVGVFPLVGMQALERLAGAALKRAVPVLAFAHPLSDLDGLTIWYEARLLEEGIEDMQNLITANLPDVMLHTRVPVGRLMDWIDQALLYIHLPPASRRRSQRGTQPRDAFQRLGIRNATSFQAAFVKDPLANYVTLHPDADELVERLAAGAAGMKRADVLALARVLRAEPTLAIVRHWRNWKEALDRSTAG